MREVITDLLNEWLPKRAFDFEEFASFFPISVMCRLIGASPSAISPIRKSLEALGLSICMDPQFLPQLEEATLVLDEFVHQCVANRRAGNRLSPEQDLLDSLLKGQDEGGLSDRELADILIFLFVAGYDTSKNLLSLIMVDMVDRPADWKRCAEDRDYGNRVTEEIFRFHSVA